MPVNIAQVVTSNRKRLYQGQPGTSVATVYTVPSATDVRVTQIVLCNTTASSATVSVSEVPVGGAAGAANRVIDAMPVDPHGTVVIGPLSSFLTAGDFLAALQGTSGAVTVTVHGETYV